MEELILKFYKKADAKGRISIPNSVIKILEEQRFNMEIIDNNIVILTDKFGKTKMDKKNRISLSLKTINKIGTDLFYMDVYKNKLKLIPIRKAGK